MKTLWEDCMEEGNGHSLPWESGRRRGESFGHYSGAEWDEWKSGALQSEIQSWEIGDWVRIRSARMEVKETARIIDRYFADSGVLEEKLRELPLSMDRIRHLFSSQTGMTIQQYRRRCQLRQAAMLLTCSPLSVYEIAEAVGIPDAPYFCRLFREYYGEKPGVFRKNTFWGRRADSFEDGE